VISYSQYWGIILRDNMPVGAAYSGHGQGLNNPNLETVHSIGPIPKGHWRIVRWYDDPHLGPCVAELEPFGHDAHGRTAFRIHGDNPSLNHTASDGCIIAGPNVRHTLRDSGATDLVVTQ